MRKLIVIGDYCRDTVVCQEIRSSVDGFLKNQKESKISFISVTPSTIHTSYVLQQIVLTEERYGIPEETVFFVNTDPRIERDSYAPEAEGSKGVIIKLVSGIYVTGPNSGFCFSMIKERIQAVFTYEPLSKGSQFRSRDNYPRIIAHLMDYMEDELETDSSSKDIIKELKGFYVGHIDNYGNIKTTITHEDLKGKLSIGDVSVIEINNTKQEAKYVDNLFGGRVGQLVIYPGSSGRPDNPYMEISCWSHFGDTKQGEAAKTGKDFFEGISPGSSITIDL
ncbi:hypothetical protein A3H80_03660 [Candidatus Roizmanbacteria bacterium RIFCSPLOWO2_02_FULL_37_19]|uniref:S-adenosyl-l-methionine hydroxide adenosyltransferase C-terminal domain-containing protein n=1 Tax=Candidatus Roizmanbacteria bacterium RIFCSPHIGHO2_02_FULL_37_24 TaxID=1802037 RepID=A0A1F7GVM4_9BACT|nr:MAG: hypothetical protein A2862_04570 [Candidatus Roizmanbacteria bacterium RIFCSPHIGHO2_01_FULL_38_41]OGK22933.1 MAG: hypothetical protein A3C24_03680 [Candidatus Roizmanbacteria bacterium RIFCSPHIGHO2_02_FULL_37_24]OGK33613.1 MAG: hypothetical protein A3E10_05105 [Candidatus Roizmanbacteria bacterium RIFCSPHIGHO2_12_FULL_37_23]OGK44182.1 MAG: hypothetical protein A2956_00775 [Candidatus Roizmanbacteria bacterium RIFCSPLOWO2_01_FULL_37_57]OGK55265.1 MAG: hypothetical protein A3H80_03660 [Ca